MRTKILTGTFLMLLAGCSVGKDVPVAEAAIGTFHQQFDAGEFQASYMPGARI